MIIIGSIFFVFALGWAALFFGLIEVLNSTVAVVFRFGRFNRVLTPGLRPVIPLLERVEVYTTAVRQFELPDEPENIDRQDDDNTRTLLPGKKPPYRVNHKGKEEAIFYVKKADNLPEDDPASYDRVPYVKYVTTLNDEQKRAMEKDSLHAPLTSEISVVVEYYLKYLLTCDEADVKNFVENVSPESGRDRVQEVRKRMEDMVSRALQEILGPVTLGHAVERLPLFSRMIRERLEILVGEKAEAGSPRAEKPWGIHIADAYIKSIYAGRTVNKARSSAAASVSRREETINDAEAARVAETKKADATAYAKQKAGEGEAAAIKAMAEAMKDPNAQFLASLDAAREVLPKSNFVVVPSDLGAIASIVSLGAKTAQSATKNQ